MKNWICICLLGFSLGSCTENDAPIKKQSITNQEVPPFRDFQYSTRFDLPSKTASTYTNLDYCNFWAQYNGESEMLNEMLYSFYAVESMPNNSQITISFNGDELTMRGSGVVARSGENIPDGYTGSAADWSPTLMYEITVKANISTKAILSGSMKLSSDFFALDYDIANVLQFNEWDNASLPEWSISTKTQLNEDGFKDLESLRIVFTVNDCYGTAIKK